MKKRQIIGQTDAVALPVDPTGVPNLDVILGGGLPRRALVIVAGVPGSGKTTLANQIAFHAAQSQQRVLVLTALSEPTDKLIGHLRTHDFFAESLVGDEIQFLSMQQFLKDESTAINDDILSLARQARVKLVVLDGFRSIRESVDDPRLVRYFLYELGAKLGLLGITTIITSEADPRDAAFFREATTADIIIGMHYHLVGMRHQRAIEVIKMRGAALLPGLHGVSVDKSGIYVAPRLESIVQKGSLLTAGLTNDAEGDEQPAGRASFGLPELDALLDGGLPVPTSTILTGSSGTGKTLLALNFAVQGVRMGEPTVLVSLRESRQQLQRKADGFTIGAELREALHPGGLLTMLRWPPVDLDPDIIANQILGAIDRVGARRLVFDGLTDLEHAVLRSSDAGRVSDFFAALFESLLTRHVTSLFVSERQQASTANLNFLEHPISFLAENLLLLQQMSHLTESRRTLSIIKMCFSAHNFMDRDFVISAPEGIRVLGLVESGDGVVSATKQQVGMTDQRGVAPINEAARQQAGAE